jgi:F-type H+-transporting ATPase subunit b
VVGTVAQFAEGSSGIGALGVDGKAFVIQLVSFLLAFLVLQRFAFKPIMKIMEQRRHTIESGVALGEEMKQKQVELEKQVDRELAQARKDADGIIAEARNAAKAVGTDLEVKAKQRADGLVAAAEERIAQDTKRARKVLERELVSLVSDATETIIGEKVDAKKDAQLIDRALKGDA